MVINDGSVHSEEGKRRGAGLAGSGSGQGRNHVGTGLGLPPGVDDRALLMADVLVKPHPGFGIDRLTHRAKQAKR